MIRQIPERWLWNKSRKATGKHICVVGVVEHRKKNNFKIGEGPAMVKLRSLGQDRSQVSWKKVGRFTNQWTKATFSVDCCGAWPAESVRCNRLFRAHQQGGGCLAHLHFWQTMAKKTFSPLCEKFEVCFATRSQTHEKRRRIARAACQFLKLEQGTIRPLTKSYVFPSTASNTEEQAVGHEWLRFLEVTELQLTNPRSWTRGCVLVRRMSFFRFATNPHPMIRGLANQIHLFEEKDKFPNSLFCCHFHLSGSPLLPWFCMFSKTHRYNLESRQESHAGFVTSLTAATVSSYECKTNVWREFCKMLDGGWNVRVFSGIKRSSQKFKNNTFR